jgi:hypothetical protein
MTSRRGLEGVAVDNTGIKPSNDMAATSLEIRPYYRSGMVSFLDECSCKLFDLDGGKKSSQLVQKHDIQTGKLLNRALDE